MDSLRPPPTRRRWERWVWVAYWLGLFTLTHLPRIGRIPAPARHVDKAVHFCLFFGLTYIGNHAWNRGTHFSVRRALRWSLAYLVYAAFDEWLQSYVGRTPSLGDWLADAAGILAATLWALRGRMFGHREEAETGG